MQLKRAQSQYNELIKENLASASDAIIHAIAKFQEDGILKRNDYHPALSDCLQLINQFWDIFEQQEDQVKFAKLTEIINKLQGTIDTIAKVRLTYGPAPTAVSQEAFDSLGHAVEFLNQVYVFKSAGIKRKFADNTAGTPSLMDVVQSSVNQACNYLNQGMSFLNKGLAKLKKTDNKIDSKLIPIPKIIQKLQLIIPMCKNNNLQEAIYEINNTLNPLNDWVYFVQEEISGAQWHGDSFESLQDALISWQFNTVKILIALQDTIRDHSNNSKQAMQKTMINRTAQSLTKSVVANQVKQIGNHLTLADFYLEQDKVNLMTNIGKDLPGTAFQLQHAWEMIETDTNDALTELAWVIDEVETISAYVNKLCLFQDFYDQPITTPNDPNRTYIKKAKEELDKAITSLNYLLHTFKNIKTYHIKLNYLSQQFLKLCNKL